MLQIKNIEKTYKTGNLVQKALNNVSLNLRDNEFVAILGPSGSGKTTLLNIIGGLDKYDTGDLIINNISTKNYKNKDWDSYRNHTIGFVFQSYNLIPHQTILANVELALTISGISKSQRKQKALDALEKVGLKEQAHKKPNQMSGGQMQRVAIARALVNNPAIVLADEPTGALDTKTSIQVMELLKEVAKDRLVVMVTHNPELAKEYANRIVNLKDGEIIGDSNPYEIIESKIQTKKEKIGKAHMSYLTALSLSFNNLLSKKGRTILTAFAGSIGIIGIALILALSTGFQNYIDSIQEDTMSSYPLTIQAETSNVFSAILSAHMTKSEEETNNNTISEQMMISSMMNSVGSNDLKSFISYLKQNEDLYKNDVKKISYSYSISPRIYTKDITNTIVQLNPSTLMSSFYSEGASSLLSSVSSSSSMGTFVEYDKETIEENCELLSGQYPTKYNELLLVLSDKEQISDLLVYSLGLRDNSELKTLINEVMSGEEVSINNTPKTFTYEDLMNVELKLVDASSLYKYNSKYNTFEDMASDEKYLEDVYQNAESLKIVGIAYNDNSSSSIAGVVYLPDLTKHVIDKAKQSAIVQKQLANKDIDVFSGNKFDDENKTSELNFNDLISVDEDKLKNAFSFNLDTSTIENVDYANIIMDNSKEIKQSITDTTDGFSKIITSTDKELSNALIAAYNAMFTKTFNYVESCSGGSFIDENNPYLGCKFDDDKVKGIDYASIDNFKYSLIDGYKTITYVLFPDTIEGQDTKEYFLNIFVNEAFDNKLDEIIKTFKDKFSLTTSKENIKKVIFEIFNEYFDTVRQSPYFDSTNKYIKLEDLNNILVEDIQNEVLSRSDNANMIYGESYNSAKEFISLLAAKTISEVVSESVSPFTKIFSNMEDAFKVDTDAFSSAFNFEMDEDELSRLMSSMLTSSSASYSNNLINLGYQEEDKPTSISFYFNDFNSKENFLNLIDNYNNTVNDKDKEISYTDITGILISSVQTIVNAVTYVLIAFVSISLIVSSIMIAIITLISVMERTKEIGILRAMGASKHNVSSIFNAETFIIGLLSGTIGVVVSYLLTIPINNIIHKLTDIYEINAVLNLKPAIILILISVFLTMIAGFIPSKKAAKQDPVIALRSE